MATDQNSKSSSLRRAYVALSLISKGDEVSFKMNFVAARSADEAVGVALRSLQEQFPEWKIGYPDAIEITPEEIAQLNVDTLKPAVPINKEDAA